MEIVAVLYYRTKGLITSINFRTCAVCFMLNHPYTTLPSYYSKTVVHIVTL